MGIGEVLANSLTPTAFNNLEAWFAVRRAETGSSVLEGMDEIQVLAHLNKYFELARGREGERLWCVLTALRGPDTPSDEVKVATTLPIREAALPFVAKYYSFPVPTGSRTVTLHAPGRRSHFEQHIASAADVLGLEIVVKEGQ